MKRNKAQTLPKALALATVLAAGALFLWQLISVWASSVGTQVLGGAHPREQLVITEQGEPIVESSRYGFGATTTYRTLGGEPIESLDNVELQNGGGWFLTVKMSKALQRDRTSWSSRILGFPDPSGAPNYWYLIIPGVPSMPAYFVGFDGKTKQRVGYLGTKGFRSDLPPIDEQFSIASSGAITWGMVAGQTYSYGEEPNQNYYWKGQPKYVFFNSDGKLLRIDLRHRSIEPIPLAGNVVSLGNLYKPVRTSDSDTTAQKVQIGAMLEDRIAILDDTGKLLKTLPILAEASDRVLQVFMTTGDEVILVAMADWNHELTDAFWMNGEGAVQRHEQVTIAGGAFATDFPSPWLSSAALPSPLLLALQIGFTNPRLQLMAARYDDFPQALAASLARSWPAVLAVMAISAALAVVTYRRHLRFSREGALVWAIFTLLVGPAGYVGYLTHRRWPAREVCGQCHRPAPIDRPECLICDAEFPLPAARGIEIFA